VLSREVGLTLKKGWLKETYNGCSNLGDLRCVVWHKIGSITILKFIGIFYMGETPLFISLGNPKGVSQNGEEKP